ncbi:MAG: DUF2306 domain-containing protein [Caulobacteraceae bacterium]
MSKASATWLWVATVLAVGLGLASYRYLVLGLAGAPTNVAANRFATTPFLIVHVVASATALILGALQLHPRLRARWPAWHRRAGALYVIAVVAGGAAGLVLAAGTSAGPIAAAGFALLALLWVPITVHAWRLARARDFARHRPWMIRSYALTFAAVTLRLYLAIAAVAHLDFMTGYRAISFLCWVPNLVVAEFAIRASRPLRTSPPLAAPWRSRG